MSRYLLLGLALSLTVTVGCDTGSSGSLSPSDPGGSTQQVSVTIQGTVRRWDDSTPVPGVPLEMVQVTPADRPDMHLGSTTSDANGRYTLRVSMDCSTGWDAVEYGLETQYPYWPWAATGTIRPLTKQVCQSDFRLDIWVTTNDWVAP